LANQKPEARTQSRATTLALERREWIYLVRSLGLVPEPSSHDWHVQPSCQRTESPSAWAARLQSRTSLPMHERDAHAYTNLPVLETCSNYASARRLSTHCNHRISTCFSQPWGAQPIKHFCHSRRLQPWGICFSLFSARDKTHLPLGSCARADAFFRQQPRRKTISLKKDHLEVLANDA